jgi:hypothetical protein
MEHTTCFVCLVSNVSGHHKNTPVRASASSRHITKLEQSTCLRNLCVLLSAFVYVRESYDFLSVDTLSDAIG